MKTDTVGKLIEEQRPSEAQSALQEVSSIVRDTYQEVRESIDQLAVETFPLIPALDEYVEEFEQRSGIKTHFERPAGAFQTPLAADFQLMRIIQEALANIRRHAQASTAWITLESTSKSVELVVRDDGEGFSPSTIAQNGAGHHGVQGMRERAESLGGTLDIDSDPGQGTEIRVSVPRGGLRG